MSSTSNLLCCQGNETEMQEVIDVLALIPLCCQGNETEMQEEPPAPTSATPPPAGESEGVPIYDGTYKRYNFSWGVLELPVKYAPGDPIGRGAYGIVW